ncbi:MAG: GtrA family protein [Candidatus Saccharimonadales bacterium]
MKTNKRKNLIRLITEFAKLQLAGYIPFWGKYLGFAFFDTFTSLPTFYALLIPMVLANIVFFYVDDKWVFSHPKGSRKTTYEAVKFTVFILLSEIVVLMITYSLYNFANLTPYIGQFISGCIMAIWTFFGLRFWVFDSTTPAKRRRTTKTRRSKAARSRRSKATSP